MIILALVIVLLVVGIVVFGVSAKGGRLKMLKVLYALAIALLVVAFVGFGISAFYPAPEYPEPPAEVQSAYEESDPTPKQEELIREQAQREKAYEAQFSDYNQVVSSISIGVAVLLLVGSILWLSSLDVIGDGVTLGAVFTLFYGLIRAFMTESEVFRFIAVGVGLVVVITLVYLRFVRSAGKAEPA
ncbi:MAG TPA: hypothetical protein VHM69_11350 [Rubrobacter sp.]|nr:hypothetical protein [Rubrobacter sp.]